MPLKWTRIHFLKGQITDHPNSSLTKSLDALDNFERGATAIVLEVSLLRAQVRGFVTVNELLSRRQRKQKKKKKNRIRARGLMSIEDTRNVKVQMNVHGQLQDETRGYCGRKARVETRSA